eukprot:718029-Amphidinium_carterae.1
MQRIIATLAVASCAILGAQCFLTPFSQPMDRQSYSMQSASKQIMGVSEAASSSSWSPLALGVAFGMLVAVASARPVMAADIENG